MRRLEFWIPLVVSSLLAVVGWSLNRNVEATNDKIDNVALEVRTMTATVGGHSTDIAVLRSENAELRKRLEGLEDRERGEHGPFPRTAGNGG